MERPTLRILFMLLTGLLAVGGCAPLNPPDREANNAADAALHEELAEPPPVPLTLDAAIAYALEHNLELWVARQEIELRSENASGARLAMLPRLLVDAEASRRDRYHAATSVSLESGRESLEPSYSAEKERRTLDVTAVWDLLDFGVAYTESRQAEARERVAWARLERARQAVVLSTTEAWWRAVATRSTAELAQAAGEDVAALRAAVEQAVERGAMTKTEGLRRQAPLLEQQLRLEQYRQAHRTALAELVNVLGTPPGMQVELPQVEYEIATPIMNDVPVDKLEQEALLRRPELAMHDWEEVVSLYEARQALVQMLPGIRLFGRYQNDQNKYLYYDHWYSAGIQAAWNLLRLPQAFSHRRAALLERELVQRRRVAQAAAILTQLHLALAARDEAADALILAQELAEMRSALVEALAREEAAGEGTGEAMLDHRLRQLAAQAQYLDAFVRLHGAMARVDAAIGRDTLLRQDLQRIDAAIDACAALPETAFVLPEEASPVARADASPATAILPAGRP